VTDKRVATETLNDKLTKVAKREHLGVLDDTGMPFAEFADLWLKRVSPTLRSRTHAYWNDIVEKHLKPEFTGPLRSLTLASVEAYAARRVDGSAAPATVNNALTVLRHLMRRAVAWEYLGRNPLEKLQLLRELPGRTRFLRQEEIDTLLGSFPRPSDTSLLVRHYLRPFVLLAMNTGA
jgi:site-specific recombinase XerD